MEFTFCFLSGLNFPAGSLSVILLLLPCPCFRSVQKLIKCTLHHFLLGFFFFFFPLIKECWAQLIAALIGQIKAGTPNCIYFGDDVVF